MAGQGSHCRVSTRRSCMTVHDDVLLDPISMVSNLCATGNATDLLNPCYVSSFVL